LSQSEAFLLRNNIKRKGLLLFGQGPFWRKIHNADLCMQEMHQEVSMVRIKDLTHSLLAFVFCFFMALPQSNAENGREHLSQLVSGSMVLMLRHAYAPGTSDPPDFRLDDCTTQRNLNDEGRAQARRLGAYLRQAGIREADVYSSQWCRCLETAALLDLGEVRELPALNSFYDRPADRKARVSATRAFLASLGERTNRPVVLVTHFVTISAIAGTSVRSGAGILLDLNGTADPVLVRRFVIE